MIAYDFFISYPIVLFLQLKQHESRILFFYCLKFIVCITNKFNFIRLQYLYKNKRKFFFFLKGWIWDYYYLSNGTTIIDLGSKVEGYYVCNIELMEGKYDEADVEAWPGASPKPPPLAICFNIII